MLLEAKGISRGTLPYMADSDGYVVIPQKNFLWNYALLEI
jgi:hypothetical protein